MKKDFAEVKTMLIGYFRWISENKCCASCTVTLIQDGGTTVLVDTGTRNNQSRLIKALAKERLEPADIDFVVITHFHTDHLENLGIFHKAKSINAFEIKKGDTFELSEDLLTKGERKLTKNVKLIYVPGHTEQCVAVLAKTEKGNIVVAGDLFVKKQEEQGVFTENEQLWQKSREKIIKLADYIIPGHGPIFKVKK